MRRVYPVPLHEIRSVDGSAIDSIVRGGSDENRKALAEVYGRHRAEIKALSGVYKREVGMTDGVARDGSTSSVARRNNCRNADCSTPS